MRKQICKCAPLLVAALLVLIAQARATSLRRMSVAEMSRAAATIVRAKCARQSVGWDAGEI